MTKPSQLASRWAYISGALRKDMRAKIIERDGANCHHCGRATITPCGRFLPEDATIDHWPVPKRDLPEQRWLDPSTAVIACLECNRRLDRESQQQKVAA